MSSYGIEIFDASGKLVFSSERRTVQILQAGHFTLDWDWFATATVTFPPVSKRPQIYAQLAGRTNVWANNSGPYYDWDTGGLVWDVDWYQMYPTVGPFKKNSDGKYNAITFSNRAAFLLRREFGRPAPGANSGQQFKDIPYVIFF